MKHIFPSVLSTPTTLECVTVNGQLQDQITEDCRIFGCVTDKEIKLQVSAVPFSKCLNKDGKCC